MSRHKQALAENPEHLLPQLLDGLGWQLSQDLPDEALVNGIVVKPG